MATCISVDVRDDLEEMARLTVDITCNGSCVDFTTWNLSRSSLCIFNSLLRHRRLNFYVRYSQLVFSTSF